MADKTCLVYALAVRAGHYVVCEHKMQKYRQWWQAMQ